MLKVRFTRLSPKRHRLEIVRVDGSADAADLETRSLLLHDLVHFAFESEARLTQSFYGLLASGRALAALQADDATFPTAEAQLTERIVGPLSAVVQGKSTIAGLLVGLRNLQHAYAEPMPDWLTEALLQRVVARFRRLDGQWKATPFGTTMELVFDVAEAPAC